MNRYTKRTLALEILMIAIGLIFALPVYVLVNLAVRAPSDYGVNAKAKHKDLALKFITYIMSPTGMKLFNQKQGSLPTLPNAGSAVDPGLTELSTFVKDNRTVPFMDQLWPNAKVQQTMLSGLQEVFSNQSTPDKVLTQMDQQYKAGT